MDELQTTMLAALAEARLSLREGNHGFGAVIIKDGGIIAQAHDCEESEHDSTSHAEMNAIRLASKTLGKNLSGCILVSTHEPCPMCASAIVWSGINEIAYGYSIEQSLAQGRRRINLSCREVFDRAGKTIVIHAGVLKEACEILYQKSVRDEVKRLRNISVEALEEYNADSIRRRLEWFKENKDRFTFLNDDPLESAYRLLLCRFNIDADQAPVVRRETNRLTFHSMNFCPTLEACKILDLDTRFICKRYNENSTDTLIKQIDSRLQFERNYEKLRPYSDYCEEMIYLPHSKLNSLR
jgi:tRNA(adenine34) deaminase